MGAEEWYKPETLEDRIRTAVSRNAPQYPDPPSWIDIEGAIVDALTVLYEELDKRMKPEPEHE